MTPLRQIVVERPLLAVGCTLGESPLYDPDSGTLHFVDIDEKKVYHLDVASNELSFEQFKEPITCLALRPSGKGLACTTASGFALIETNSDLKYLYQPFSEEYREHVRFNDGACDSKGRFFAGSVYSKERSLPGLLWRYDPEDGTCVVVDEGPFTDSNGVGWSSDEKTLFFTDSLTNLIYAYDYDDGKLSNRRVFIDGLAQGLPEGTFPDGFCFDSEGGLWWGGSRIIRFTTDGKMDLEIVFPTALNVTACCFGGPNEDQLYVTSAHCGAVGGDASRQARYPDSGHLFVVDLAGQYKGGKWRHRFLSEGPR